MGIVEAALILTVAALYLSIVTGRIGANQLVSNVQLCSGPLKERDQLTVGLCKAIGKLKTIVSLDTFDGEAVLFGANTIRYSHLCLLCNKIFISSCNDLDLLCPLMQLANLHNSNIGGLLLEASYSHQHSRWFIVAEAPKKLEKVSFSHFFDTLTGGMMPPANDF